MEGLSSTGPTPSSLISNEVVRRSAPVTPGLVITEQGQEDPRAPGLW